MPLPVAGCHMPIFRGPILTFKMQENKKGMDIAALF